MKSIKILHLEDNDQDAELIRKKLFKEGMEFSITRASNQKEFFSAIDINNFDVILSDNSLPDFDGISALRYSKEHKPQTPFIFVSGTIGEERAVEALRWGASDYVNKDFLNKLLPAVQRVIHESETEQARIQVEEDLIESEEKFRKAFMTSPDAVTIAGLDDGRLITINESFKMILGFTDDETIGHSSLELNIWVNPIDRKIIVDKIKAGGIVNNYETRFRKKNGEIIDGLMSASLVELNGKPCVLNITRDITERKRAEEELIKAKKQAEEMNLLKNYFLSNMSHELRTPLISVIGFAELLQEEIQNEKHSEYIRLILEGGQRLNTTLNSILEFSKLESEKDVANLRPLNLAEQILKNVESIRHRAMAKNLFLRAEINDGYLKANIDAELFSQLLFHIISNGIKFTHRGGVLITLSQVVESESEWAVIKVIDTGIGIPKENIEKVFYAFRQSSEGYSRNYEGTGLGLTISQRIIELLKGNIKVKSEVGRGSEFSIWLPAVLDERQIKIKVEEKRRSTVIEPPTKIEKGMKNVLVVEDNSSNRMLMNRYLSKHGRVIEAEDGISGVSMALKERFDLILMDINLGAGINGVEAMRQIRKIKGYSATPIIAITAYAMAKDRDDFLKEGFDNYLAKPFTKEALLTLVEKTIEKEII
ncbi:MAG: response regulator [bacterium]